MKKEKGCHFYETPCIWEKGQTSAYYCHNLSGSKAGIKLYCLVTEADVCEQLAQGRYLAVPRPGVEPATSGLQV